MKAAFVHDHIFYYSKNTVFSKGGLPNDVLKRYLDYFDELVVMGRGSEINEEGIKNLVESSGEKISFQLNLNYNNPKQLFIDNKEVINSIISLVDSVDVCIVRLPSVLGLLTVKECIRKNKPWIVEVVTCCWDSFWNYGNLKGKVLAPIMYLLNRYYISKSQYTIYVSKQFLQNRYPSYGIVGSASDVNIDMIKQETLNNRLNKIKEIGDRTINLGLIGSLNVEFKGHRTALKAVKLLKESGFDISLKCLGGGGKDKWEKLSNEYGIGDNVIFSGTLPPGEKVFEWLDDIDIFIMPSLQEGLPRALVESMSRGCPVVATRVGGIPELIEDNYLIPPKDHYALVEKIVLLLSNKTLLEQQAQRNFLESSQYCKNKIDLSRNEFWLSVTRDLKERS